MQVFKPNMYVKDILNINYDYLKTKGIKLLLFDFDNTLISKHTKLNLTNFFEKLKQDFEIIIVSNTLHKNLISSFSEKYNINYIMSSMKPFKYGFNKVKTIFKIPTKKTCLIGDQLITDIFGGNKMGYYTVLVDPFEKEELIFTKINRFFEKTIFKKNNFKRGNYYD